ncbi:MAG: hypothetical protein HYS13_17530 [Planctomycetia bacterium]|nr:hypothetical protein [Planctomycetia bacterium]
MATYSEAKWGLYDAVEVQPRRGKDFEPFDPGKHLPPGRGGQLITRQTLCAFDAKGNLGFQEVSRERSNRVRAVRPKGEAALTGGWKSVATLVRLEGDWYYASAISFSLPFSSVVTPEEVAKMDLDREISCVRLGREKGQWIIPVPKK